MGGLPWCVCGQGEGVKRRRSVICLGRTLSEHFPVRRLEGGEKVCGWYSKAEVGGRGAFRSSRCFPWHPSPSMAALTLTVFSWASLDS